MGIRNALRLIESGEQLGDPNSYPRSGIVSPWQQGQLSQIVWSDIFGAEANIVSRAEAMSIPAVAKARQILVSTIARYPLRALNAQNEDVTSEHSWMFDTDGEVSPWHRMAWTIDDLIFSGWSLWGVERDADGAIVRGDRCPIERWQVTPEGVIQIQDATGSFVDAEADSVILIPGAFEGLLKVGSRTIRAGAKLESSVLSKSQNPIPAIELHATTDDPLEPDEVLALVNAWAAARMDENGAIAFTPHNIEIRAHGETEASLLIEGRNFLRIDIGAFLGIPAALMDASLSTASLTYSTQEGQRNEFADFTLPYWLEPIQQRLSMDDVVPAGTRVRFDLSDLYSTTQPATGTEVAD
jgi:hypothetical protein